MSKYDPAFVEAVKAQQYYDYFKDWPDRCPPLLKWMLDSYKVPETAEPSEPSPWEALREAAKQAHEDLIWCSGSSDFGPDGQAEKGWVKVGAHMAALRTALARVEGEEHSEWHQSVEWSRAYQAANARANQAEARAEKAERELATAREECREAQKSYQFVCSEVGENVGFAVRGIDRLKRELAEARKERDALRERLDRFNEACAVLGVQPNESIVDAAKRIYREFSARGERIAGLREGVGKAFTFTTSPDYIESRNTGQWFECPPLAALLAEQPRPETKGVK